jgi:kynurenine formamidase
VGDVEHLSNWGRWGEEDERGTANLITPQRVAAAARLIRTGRVISCALPIGEGMPIAPHRTRPLRFEGPRAGGFAEDFLALYTHSGTHWDALGHCFGDSGDAYNGFPAAGGRNSVDALAASLVGRGVLIDVPRHLGLARLQPGFAVTADLLDECIADQDLEVRSGDIVLLRTGHLAWFRSLADKRPFEAAGEPGIGGSVVAWLHERGVAALAADNSAIEVRPPQEPADVPFPIHPLLLRDLGLTLGELWYLEELADACASDGSYEFFLSAAPLAIEGGLGSPINPIAIK